MHVDDAVRAGPLVQIVDILGDERQAAAPGGEPALEPRQRKMRRIRLCVPEVLPPRVIEGEHALRVAREGFGRRELHRVEPRPDPTATLVAERAEPALGRDAGAGQHEECFDMPRTPTFADASGQSPRSRRLPDFVDTRDEAPFWRGQFEDGQSVDGVKAGAQL